MGRGRSKLKNGGTKNGDKPTGDGVPNDATEYYVSGEGMWINNFLRGRGDFGELSEQEKQFISDLDKATNGTLSDDTLYRSVDASAIFGNMSNTDFENLQDYVLHGANAFGKGNYAKSVTEKVKRMIDSTIGKNVHEKGYMSTTSDMKIAENWGGFTGSDKPVVLRISAKGKAKGVNLSKYDKNVSKDMAQKERLLARNQDMKVKKVSSHNGSIIIDVDLK